MSIDLSDYVDVPERIRAFREKYPDGVLQAEILPSPFNGFIVVKGYAYRTPDDATPGTGLAWEPVPGKTPYTKDSELQNAETSAWGRAIVAVGASDAKRIATQEDVRNRAEASQRPGRPAPKTQGRQRPADDSPPFDAPGTVRDDQMAELSRLLGLVDAETATKQILANTGRDSLEELSASDADKSIDWLRQAEAA